jgi:hypothetical protein
MGFGIDVTTGRDLTSVRKALKELGDKGLGKEMSRGLSRAVLPLRREIRAEAKKKMPSGYGPLLSKSLRFRQQVKSGRRDAHVTERVHGDGKKERRDVLRLNEGILRHPVFGRSRPTRRGRRSNPWAAQKVDAGFITDPADRLQPQIGNAMRAVLDEVADKLRSA